MGPLARSPLAHMCHHSPSKSGVHDESEALANAARPESIVGLSGGRTMADEACRSAKKKARTSSIAPKNMLQVRHAPLKRATALVRSMADRTGGLASPDASRPHAPPSRATLAKALEEYAHDGRNGRRHKVCDRNRPARTLATRHRHRMYAPATLASVEASHRAR